MNIVDLKKYLIENPDIVEEFLIKSGFHGVKYYDSSEQWRFGMDENSSTNSIKLSKNTLTFKDFKYSENGDLISLIQLKKKINFKTAYNYIALKTNFIDTSPEYIENDIELPFGGWYKHIEHKNNEFCELVTYSKNILNEFEKIPSKLLLKDGVSISTQEKFDIRYCSESHRIIIPCLDDNKLIGAIGRFNKKNVDKNIPKYLPILKYNKSHYIFGANENSIYINNNPLYIIESEKTVLACDSKDIKNVVAIGGNSISTIQKNKILKLNPSEIVIILDKGLGKDKAEHLNLSDEEVKRYMYSILENEAMKLKNKFIPIYIFNCNNYDFIKDKDNIFDTDLDKDEVEKIINKGKVLINGK